MAGGSAAGVTGPYALALEEIRYQQRAEAGIGLIRWGYRDYYTFALADHKTFETDVRQDLKRVLGLLEPAIILGMGVLVAFIVVAMLLAIFSINDIPL